MEGIILWLICGVIAAAIGSNKGEGCLAFIVGLLLGPLGILVAVISKGNRWVCPYCKETIAKGATICKHCKKEIKN